MVALESTLITHGLPWPQNVQCALGAQAAVREHGAIPATIAVLQGTITVGLSDGEIEQLARVQGAEKVSRRNLATTVARGKTGATTVAASMWCAHRAGLTIFATGGIGGVHRGAEHTFDISADLNELGRTPMAVVCAGAKYMLDLAKTVEVLESNGVPILGFRTEQFPGFFTAHTGLPVDARFEDTASLARVIHKHRAMGLENGLLVVQPPPQEYAIDHAELEAWLTTALARADGAGIFGHQLTPYLLEQLRILSSGQTLALNMALIRANAALAAQLAGALRSIQ